MPPEKLASFNDTTDTLAAGSSLSRRLSLAAYWELTKPRLSLMAVISALFGYLAASTRDAVSFITVLTGTALAAGGAAALNQWWERGEDARMRRTADRPLPLGTLRSAPALYFGLGLSLAGPAILWAGTNALAGLLTAITVVSYILLYTPLKKVTPWSTEIGALPGALPPLIGWVAVEGSIGWVGLFLFAVLYAWQMPHFMAICWLYKEDYIRGGFRMLSLTDESGDRVCFRSIVWSTALFLLTPLPFLAGESGWIFLVGGMLLSFYYMAQAVRMNCASDRDKPARRLFFASIIFLPCYLMLMAADRILFTL